MEEMMLDSHQQHLLDQSETWVRRFLEERGAFSLFALALQPDGQIVPVQPSEDFSDTQAALGGILGALLPLAQNGSILATVICTPLPPEKPEAVVYDIESKDSGRTLAVQPFKKRLFRGWGFASKEFRSDVARLFAS